MARCRDITRDVGTRKETSQGLAILALISHGANRAPVMARATGTGQALVIGASTTVKNACASAANRTAYRLQRSVWRKRAAVRCARWLAGLGRPLTSGMVYGSRRRHSWSTTREDQYEATHRYKHSSNSRHSARRHCTSLPHLRRDAKALRAFSAQRSPTADVAQRSPTADVAQRSPTADVAQRGHANLSWLRSRRDRDGRAGLAYTQVLAIGKPERQRRMGTICLTASASFSCQRRLPAPIACADYLRRLSAPIICADYVR